MNKDPLTDRVIGPAIEVHRTLGPGLLETVYESCLCQEFSASDISFQRQVPIPVSYEGQQLAVGFRADIVIQAELLLEIKAVENLVAVHEAQILTYLRLGGFSKGLIINFNTRLLKDGIRRFVM